MEIINKFNDADLSLSLLEKIKEKSKAEINIMEVCGTHTRSIYNFGIDKLLPKEIKLISGPGCPICVTPMSYIDNAIELTERKDVIIASFGDMIRVNGSYSSLSREKAEGKDIRIVYSPLDCLRIAENNKDKEVVFLGVGFETTEPSIALSVKYAKMHNIKNYSVLISAKTMINTMKYLINDKSIEIDGFICPGHVATIAGEKVFEDLSKECSIPMVICGFKRAEILSGVLSIVNKINNCDTDKFDNLYKCFVKKDGNKKAKEIMNEVFIKCDSYWRGIGRIKESGLQFNEDYSFFDAKRKFKLKDNNEKPIKDCICGDILKGVKSPTECRLFGSVCNADNPAGPCMVSNEGICRIIYERREILN